MQSWLLQFLLLEILITFNEQQQCVNYAVDKGSTIKIVPEKETTFCKTLLFESQEELHLKIFCVYMRKISNRSYLYQFEVKKGQDLEKNVYESCFKSSDFGGTCSWALQYLKYEILGKSSRWFRNYGSM